MHLGFENKKQLYTLLTLAALLIGIGSWELYGSFAPANAAVRSPVIGPRNAAVSHPGANSQVPSIGGVSEPTLRIAQLNRTENTEYSPSGRNIFAIAPPPIAIETPIAPARPTVVATASPAKIVYPPIEVKYLGYAQHDGDPAYKAILVHKDESLIARSGDIVFHRYKVGAIQPNSVLLTDLSDQHTQSIQVIEK